MRVRLFIKAKNLSPSKLHRTEGSPEMVGPLALQFLIIKGK